MIDATATAAGECKLLEQAEAGEKTGRRWAHMVKRGLDGEKEYQPLASRPLVRTLQSLSVSVLMPLSNNFTPEKRTPWGGDRIVRELKADAGISAESAIVGESWEFSDHPSFPNRFECEYAGTMLTVSIHLLSELFPDNIYGKAWTQRHGAKMPWLVKFLNSGSWKPYLNQIRSMCSERKSGGAPASKNAEAEVTNVLCTIADMNYHEIHRSLGRLERMDFEGCEALKQLHQAMLSKNLSVQVHPKSTFAGLSAGEHSKTEAWIVIDAEPGAGIYLGLRKGVTRKSFEDDLRSGRDVTDLLNFVETKPGEVFFIPSGTMHAIGAGMLLVEPQETSETTYRVYDYDRTDDRGQPRKLDIEKALDCSEWEGPRGNDAVALFRRQPRLLESGGDGKARLEELLSEDLFVVDRVLFKKGDTFSGDAAAWGVSGFLVIEGAVSVRQEREKSTVRAAKGRSFILPVSAGPWTIMGLDDQSALLCIRSNGR